MADQNSYVAYKRDTRHLIYWMIHACNHVIKSSPPQSISDAASVKVNTTGVITVSAIVPISKLIAENISPIPPTIYRLFQSVIAARRATFAVFQQVVAKNPDPEVERSNASHKRFIDILTEAFEVLGGEIWASKQKPEAGDPEESVDEIIFANQFTALGIDGSDSEEEVEQVADGGPDKSPTNPSPVRSGRKSTGKGKKGKGKKTKGRKRAAGKLKPTAKETRIEEVPFESYRIIEDEDGLVTDYLMAVYSLVTQWIELRHYVQGLWREVAYSNRNSAIAGTMSNMAIAMIKQTESAIFVDFPGHESYETVMKTITRGDSEKSQGMFHMRLDQVNPAGKIQQGQNMDVDVKEQFLIHAYWDLLDFITDFQKTRTGKPTNTMIAEIRGWDPSFNLQRASKEQRIKWRRSYTINWLYDLVNVFSSIVVQRITMKGQKIALETVDWSVKGPWNKHRRLFGLSEFAGVITSLAMQKPGTDIRKRILPNHVFQLQCIVDSLTVSRGWSLNSLKGHIITPPAREFRPRRDVDLFMDRENERFGHGYCNSVDILTQFFERDAMLHGNPNRHQHRTELLKLLRDDFVNWLGETKYMHGLTAIPPSRFSNTNSNGLWEYSPFLCGVGLTEALDLAHSMNLFVWSGMPEPMSLIHLHNMLVQKGYIEREIGLYASLQQLFPMEFFANGDVPTAEYSKAFDAVIDKTGSRRATSQRSIIRKHAVRTDADLHGLLNPSSNRFFKQKSILGLYREAEWISERIPDEEVPIISSLCAIRISRTKQVLDPATGKKGLENTPLVSHARSQRMTDQTMMEMSLLLNKANTHQKLPQELLDNLPEGYRLAPPPKPKHGGILGKGTCSDLLNVLKLDIISDISSQRPVSSLNYIWVTVRMMGLFHQIEDELKRLRNPLWVCAYEENSTMMREKRASLAALVFAKQDHECMEVMAKAFQEPRAGFMRHIYWEDLDEDVPGGVKRTGPTDHDVAAASCTLM